MLVANSLSPRLFHYYQQSNLRCKRGKSVVGSCAYEQKKSEISYTGMGNHLHHCLSEFVIVRVSPKSMRGETASPEDCGTHAPGHGLVGGFLFGITI